MCPSESVLLFVAFHTPAVLDRSIILSATAYTMQLCSYVAGHGHVIMVCV
jgi:hypothetical protein